MKERKDLWELVRKKIEKKNMPEPSEQPKIKSSHVNEKKNTNEKKDKGDITPLKIDEHEIKNSESKEFKLLNQGIFAGFVYIIGIMVVLGILMVPGSITAAIGGYFGGRKSGDPARALTAAMLPFLVIASISALGSIGALPPGSGPNELSETISEVLGYNSDKNALGPISKMPDNNSSVFISLVVFGFIGGLVEVDRKRKLFFD